MTTMGVVASEVGKVDIELIVWLGPVVGGSSAQRYSLMVIVRTWRREG
jgi:hypothetical protein